jgi:hypothetical protein
MEDKTNESTNNKERLAFLEDLKKLVAIDHLICLQLVIKFEESSPNKINDVNEYKLSPKSENSGTFRNMSCSD